MKYLFINVVAGVGSTGRLVAEKCRELEAQGHECRIAYGRDKQNCEDIPTIAIGTRGDHLLHGAVSRLLDCQGFASYRATKQFLEQVREYDPDVIWLHNIHGYYLHVGLLFDYLKSSGKTVRWTLHDCWSFTGHCVHFDYVGCEKWKTGCFDCPQKTTYPASYGLDSSRRNYEKKREAFTGVPNMTIYTPSHWLANLVKQSFLREYPVEVVYNTLNTDVFHPVDSGFRRKYGLEDQFVILGVANNWKLRKGLEDFVALSQILPEDCRVVLIGLTPKEIASMPPQILGLPHTASVAELVEAYCGADVYVNPSVEETFGMTVLEARSCGTPVIVYQGTACEEVVSAYGGVAVPRGASSILAAIVQLRKEKA